MLDLGWPELLVIAIVLIVVVGPKDLPRVLRSFGRTTAKVRTMAGDFRRQFDEALREAELDEVKGLADDVRKLDPRGEIRKHLSPLEEAGRDIRKGLDDASKPKAAGNGQATPAEASDAKPAAAKPVAATKPGGTKAAKPAKTAATKTAAKAAAPKKASSAKPAAKAKSTAAARKPSTPARGKKNVGSAS